MKEKAFRYSEKKNIRTEINRLKNNSCQKEIVNFTKAYTCRQCESLNKPMTANQLYLYQLAATKSRGNN